MPVVRTKQFLNPPEKRRRVPTQIRKMHCPICKESPALNSGWQWNGQRWLHYHDGAHVPAVSNVVPEKPKKEIIPMPEQLPAPVFKLGRNRPVARCPRLSL